MVKAVQLGSCSQSLFLEDKPFLCSVQVRELGEQLEQEKARCEGLLKQDRCNVIQYFQKLEAVLARKKGACLDALGQALVDVGQAYDPLINRVEELQVGAKSFLSSSCVLLDVSWLNFAVDAPNDTGFHRKNTWTWCLLGPW